MKTITFIFISMAISIQQKAQNKEGDVFTKDEIVWIGLDFSKAKLVGQFDQGAGVMPATGSDIKVKYIPAWNMLILNEQKKYNIGKAFRKIKVFNDIGIVEKSNSAIDVDNLITYNDYKFDNSNTTIQEIISGYSRGEKADGIGLVFIIESFNKPAERASLYVTFFDIATKKVLFTEKMIGKPGGFGLRNYWAGSIKNILNQIDDRAYKVWKKNSIK